MTINAKSLLKGKFWIVNENDKSLGTITKEEDRFVYQCQTGTIVFDNESKLKKHLGKIVWTSTEVEDKTEIKINEIYGFPISTKSATAMFDIKRKLPLFTKSEKSKSLYCAGYYIINFDKGWVKSFCPKVSTIEGYEYKGPFKTEIEMKAALKNANRTT